MYKLELSPRIQNIENKFGDSIKKILYTFHWRDNLKHSEIAERIGVPRSTVTKWFHRFGVSTQSCTRFTNLNLEKHREWLRKNKKPKPKREFPWHFKKDFFERWSNEMAYVLGFLTADGCVFVNPRGSNYFSFDSTDKEIIKKIKATLSSNHKIGIRIRKSKNPNWKVSYRLQIGSKKIIKELREFGIVQNKSLIIDFPKNIPSNFLRHFVRGYFDGDGCVHFGFYYRKDRKKDGPTFTTRFSSGSRKFLVDLLKYLKKYTKIKGGCIISKNERKGYDLQFSIKDSFKLYRFMYQDIKEKQFLKRKYNTFQEAIKYYGDVA